MQGVFFLSGLPSEARRWRGVRGACEKFNITTCVERGTFADVVLAEIAFTDFGNRCELGIIETPEWNLTVENQPRSGRAEGTPTLFRLISQTNSESRLRRDELFFRQEAGAKSEAILTNFALPEIQKEFLLL